MKKVMFVFAVATMLVACGGNGSVELTVNADSTAVADSSVVATDSTVAAIPADSVSAK